MHLEVRKVEVVVPVVLREPREDVRLERARTLDDRTAFSPSPTREEWEERAADLRLQVQVAAGLYPLPPRTPLNPIEHGAIERDGYTVSMVAFESMPGHFVTGNLYVPTGLGDGPFPGILSPHGHWTDGRLSERGDEEVRTELERGAEVFESNARYHLQARAAGLARRGAVVLHYDMVGYADSRQIGHGQGLRTTWRPSSGARAAWACRRGNSMRALDYLQSRTDVGRDAAGCDRR